MCVSMCPLQQLVDPMPLDEVEGEAEADAADQLAPGPSLVGGVLQPSTEGEG
jgi:hypothetical protein